MLEATGASEFNVIQNNGPNAFQSVFHVHFHIIPKMEDGRGLSFPFNPLVDHEDARLSSSIRDLLSRPPLNNQDLLPHPNRVGYAGCTDIEPELSSGAMKLRGKTRQSPWDHYRKTPGNPYFWKIILIMIGVGLRYIFRSSHYEKIPDFEGGRVISSMHINGVGRSCHLVHPKIEE